MQKYWHRPGTSLYSICDNMSEWGFKTIVLCTICQFFNLRIVIIQVG